MSELNKIQAPVLNGAYGKNIKETFDKIDANFGVLSNRNLWKGDPGLSLVSINIPWSVLLGSPEAEYIEYGGFRFKNYYNGIREAFRKISENSDDLNAVVSQLVSTSTEHILGLGDTIVASFTEPEDGHEEDIIEFKTITPYIYVDERFRELSGNLSNLINCTDMSCVISIDYIEDDEDPQYKFICTQSFPTLYFNSSENSDGGLYWIINGSRTQIRAQGPKGLDGTTGNFYIGIAAEVTETDQRNVDTWNNLDNNEFTRIYLSYLLVPGLENGGNLQDQSHIPFVNINPGSTDYKTATGQDNPHEDAPLIVLKQIPDDYDFSTNPLIPYYISSLSISDSQGCYAVVSKYNVCYAYLTDMAVKQAIMNNVRMIPRTGNIPYEQTGSRSSTSWIPSYPIRVGEQGSDGYAIWTQPSLEHTEDPDNPLDPEFTIGYVTNVKRPSIYSVSDGEGNFSGSFVFAGRVSSGYKSRATGYLAHAEGYMTSASGKSAHSEGSMSHAEGEQSHAEGKGSHASGLASHAEGFSTTAGGSASHAEGQGTTAAGKYSHAEGYYTTVIADGGHAEGYYTRGFGKYSHAEGASSTASGDYSHAEGVNNIAAGILFSGSAVTWNDATRTHCSISLYKPNSTQISNFPQAKINKIIVKSHASSWDEYDRIYTMSLWNSGIYTENDKIIFKSTTVNYIIPAGTPIDGDVDVIISEDSEWWKTTSPKDLLEYIDSQTAHVEGEGNLAYGLQSHAEGYSNKTIGLQSHAEGYCVTARGNSSHAEGYYTETDGEGSHAEGVNSVASGSGSHAEGYGKPNTQYGSGVVQATGVGAHAEGYATCGTFDAGSGRIIASGVGAHAEGYAGYDDEVQAIGNGAHAEGFSTTASGAGAHAEGYYSVASGNYSHAEGYYSVASGSGSHAEGYMTQTINNGEHACGRYNKSGVMRLAVHINQQTHQPDAKYWVLFNDNEETFYPSGGWTLSTNNVGAYDFGWTVFSVGGEPSKGVGIVRKNAFCITITAQESSPRFWVANPNPVSLPVTGSSGISNEYFQTYKQVTFTEIPIS